MRINVLIIMLLSVCTLFSQEEFRYIMEGNRLFRDNQFAEAEIEFRRGLQANPNSFEAAFNLGNALFRQEKYAEALEQYQRIHTHDKASKAKIAAALHNTGNALLMQKKVKESIGAYKQSLKMNPNDNETRFNLAFAQHLLQNQEQEPQPQNNQNQPSQEQQQERKQDQSQPREEEISKERAEQILQALMQEEQQTMERARRNPRPERRGNHKDW